MSHRRTQAPEGEDERSELFRGSVPRASGAKAAPVSLFDHYATEHRHPVNRALHVVGIPLVLLSVAALASPWRPFGWSRTGALASLVGGWTLLFAGHAIEGNRPVILKNP